MLKWTFWVYLHTEEKIFTYGRKNIYIRKKKYLHTEEKIFTYGRKSIYIRKKKYLHTEGKVFTYGRKIIYIRKKNYFLADCLSLYKRTPKNSIRHCGLDPQSPERLRCLQEIPASAGMTKRGSEKKIVLDRDFHKIYKILFNPAKLENLKKSWFRQITE